MSSPGFPLEFVEPRKDMANAGAQKARFPHAIVRNVFLWLDKLKRKNRDCSQSTEDQAILSVTRTSIHR